MSVIGIIGCQWGDEGKGKIVDLLAQKADVVARYQGGTNAGHTVEIGNEQFILHTIPSGILYNKPMCLIGNGVVVDLVSLDEEIKHLQSRGINVLEHLFISENAHLIMPYHKRRDKAHEMKLGKGKIGTTGRGIGWAYSDKVARRGLRICEALNLNILTQKVEDFLDFYNFIFKNYFGVETFTTKEIVDEIYPIADKLRNLIIDGSEFLNKMIDENKNVLCEGAQGVHLDIDFGTYPYVTSSNPTPGGIATGLGIGIQKIDNCLGVTKAYTTRVGSGPMPTELESAIGDKIREVGKEFGATTGRPRRCGWFDAPVVRRSIELCNIKELAITKLDVLDDVDKIKICSSYKINNEKVDKFPFSSEKIAKIEPIYEEVDGWKSNIKGITEWRKLPEKAKKYLKRIEELLEAEIAIVSTGPKRSQGIVKKNYF